LIGLFVSLSKEPHSQRVSLYVFTDGDDEFDFTVRMAFLYREEVKLREFFRGIRLREGPI
jgi:hypothetical protein